MRFAQNVWQKTKKNKDATMQRRFYTKHNNKFVSECNCYLESHLCPALQGLKYDAQYDRSTNTESIYVQKQDFQKPVFYNHYYCAPEHIEPMTDIVFICENDAFGGKCCKDVLNDSPNNIQECAIIKHLKKNNVPHQIKTHKYFTKTIINVYIMDTEQLKQPWLCDTYCFFGMCADCKWHTPWKEDGILVELPEFIPCDTCPVSTPDKCPAKQMLRDGYTECESKIKCMSLLHAQSLKEKFKDGHTK